jgi:hypothetical protein
MVPTSRNGRCSGILRNEHSLRDWGILSGHPDAARYIHLLVPGEDEDEFWREVVAELTKRDAQKPRPVNGQGS